MTIHRLETQPRIGRTLQNMPISPRVCSLQTDSDTKSHSSTRGKCGAIRPRAQFRRLAFPSSLLYHGWPARDTLRWYNSDAACIQSNLTGQRKVLKIANVIARIIFINYPTLCTRSPPEFGGPRPAALADFRPLLSNVSKSFELINNSIIWTLGTYK